MEEHKYALSLINNGEYAKISPESLKYNDVIITKNSNGKLIFAGNVRSNSNNTITSVGIHDEITISYNNDMYIKTTDIELEKIVEQMKKLRKDLQEFSGKIIHDETSDKYKNRLDRTFTRSTYITELCKYFKLDEKYIIKKITDIESHEIIYFTNGHSIEEAVFHEIDDNGLMVIKLSTMPSVTRRNFSNWICVRKNKTIMNLMKKYMLQKYGTDDMMLIQLGNKYQRSSSSRSKGFVSTTKH